jgi:integrase
VRYTFHDFRRLFITDAIAHGMPPHIAQLVAGHRDINTTMGYKNYRELHQMGALPQVAWRVGEGNGPTTSGRHAA